MSSRRRRRDRPRRHGDHPEPARARPATKKGGGQRRAEFDERMARLRKMRSVIGFFGFVPLLVSIFPLGPLSEVPREIYLGLWAAIFGTFIGLTVRMYRERKAFERASAAA